MTMASVCRDYNIVFLQGFYDPDSYPLLADIEVGWTLYMAFTI
jgi:hypothetical protein